MMPPVRQDISDPAGDGVMGTVDCSVTVIQNICLSGWAFKNTQYLVGEYALCLLHVGLLWNINTDQYE